MKPEDIVGAVLRGVLTSRSKGSAKTLRRLSHGHLLSTRNVITAAAAAWGIYEAMQGSSTGGVAGPLETGPRPQPAGSGSVPPPTPSFATPQPGRAEAAAAMPPPLPVPPAEDHGFPLGVARAIRLLIAAARADGDLKPEEGALIARHAGEAGAEALVRAELQKHRELHEIVAGVGDPATAGELYALAFTVLRADEDLNYDERSWLAELERLLRLDAPAARRIEEEVAGAIDGASS